jgi:hypothetical protein
METALDSLDFVVPVFFVLVSLPMVYFAARSAKRHAARERERARAAGLSLGLELEGEDEESETLLPEGRPERVVGRLRLVRLLKGLGLPTGWRLGGVREGVRVEIFPETRSSGKSSTTYTIVRAWFATPLGQEIRVAREGFFTKLGKALFGLEDVEIGDAAFDAALRVKAKDPLAARLRLDRPEAKEALLALIGTHHGAFVTGDYAQWEKVGTKLDEAELRSVLGLLLPAAKALGG